jgi:hypothetical protein
VGLLFFLDISVLLSLQAPPISGCAEEHDRSIPLADSFGRALKRLLLGTKQTSKNRFPFFAK